jgi:hypothetical protein
MGNAANIDHERFPKQGRYYGSRAKVCFHYNTRLLLDATVVRDDMEEPWIQIFRLDDGRHVLASECQWQPAPWEPERP